MRLADLEVAAGIDAIDLPFVELLEDMLEKGIGEAFGQLFFSQSRGEQTSTPWSRVFVGLRYAPASSNPRPRGGSPKHQHLSPFELADFSFCSRPDSEAFVPPMQDAEANHSLGAKSGKVRNRRIPAFGD